MLVRERKPTTASLPAIAFSHSSYNDHCWVDTSNNRHRNLSADHDFGLQVSKEQFDKILDMIKKGEEQGAKLETGGKRHGDKGYYIEPTVFSNVQDDNLIATDEIFGPVQSILKWSTIEEV